MNRTIAGAEAGATRSSTWHLAIGF
jgi:hypothetical protein